MKIFDPADLERWGVEDFGFTSESKPASIDRYNEWVASDLHLPLTYLEGERRLKRQSIKAHWPEFSSAVVFLFSYHTTHQELQNLYKSHPDWNGLKLASYTLGFEGADYHEVIKARLIEIGGQLQAKHPGLEYKLTLDTHPVLERDLAMRAGLGWFGKNSMLINRESGSFFIIGSLLLNQELKSYEKKIEIDHCGQCTRCIDACPTEAIDAKTRTIIAKDCISTFTIEQFKLDTLASGKMTLKEGTIFGCDICQDVCPWNKRVDRLNPTNNKSFVFDEQNKIIDFFLLKDKNSIAQDLESMSEGEFKRRFGKTSFLRSGKRGLLKNIRFYLKELNILS